MSGGFASLGFDPAPGDVAAAAHVVSGVAATARALEEISALLSGAANGTWRGHAAIAFRDLLADDFRPKVDAAAASFAGAHRALGDWLETMHVSGSRARSLEDQHAEAVRRARSAHAAVAGLPGVPSPTGAPQTPDQARAEADRARERATAGRAASAADAEVERIERAARDLLHEYEELGRQAAARLQHAMDIAPDEPGFWSRLAEGVGAALAGIEEFAADVRDSVVQLLEQIAPLLEVISTLAGNLSTVLGILAFVPALQFLAGPALALAAVALVADYGVAVGRTGDFSEALTDHDVVMGMLGVAVGKGAMVVGDRVVAAARVGNRATVSGGVRMEEQLIGPRVETAAGYFELARSTSYEMGESELLWRVAEFHLDAAGLGQMVIEEVEALREPAREVGPLLARPSAVG
jgi:hypothetical protein